MSVTMVVPFPRRDARPERRSVDLRDVPERPVLALIDNGKPRAGTLLTAIANALIDSGSIARYKMVTKRASIPLTPEELAELLDGAHVVVSGVGDCGGCTASSVTDALNCIELGVPSSVLITTAFTGLAAATDRAFGLDGLRTLVVDHPVWNRDEAWFAARGAELAQAWRADSAGVAGSAAGGAASVDDALRTLTAALDADGYALRVNLDGDRALLRVEAVAPDACPDCLVPADLFGDIAHAAMVGAGLRYTREQIDVALPAAH
jgi:hypothetical protein